MGTRAGIIVTGTEVLTGRVADRNGPWLAEQLRGLGVDITHTIVVGDRPDDLLSALSFLREAGVQLIITSGGLGPTADDLTAEIVGRFQGRALSLDPALEGRIAAIVDRLVAARGWRVDQTWLTAGTRKQALVPFGAEVLEPTGTAPGLVVPAPSGVPGPPVLVLPGPPSELQGMWPAATASSPVVEALSGREEIRQRTIRMWGTLEADLAATMREHPFPDLEITTCLRGGELEIVTRFPPAAAPSYDAFEQVIASAYADTAFSLDGSTVDEVVASSLRRQGLTVATAESCTAGLLASRLTDLAGSSDYVRGGLVVYSNEAKRDLAGVPMELIERVGAVSEDVAIALAAGARSRLGADVGVGITGIAGPGGGTADKPVGLVHVCVSDGTIDLARKINAPGSRADVRARTVGYAMHLIRRLLETRVH